MGQKFNALSTEVHNNDIVNAALSFSSSSALWLRELRVLVFISAFVAVLPSLWMLYVQVTIAFCSEVHILEETKEFVHQ